MYLVYIYIYTNFPPGIIDGRVIHPLLQFVILKLSSIVHYLLMLTLILYQNLLTSIYVGLDILESIALSVPLSYLLMLKYYPEFIIADHYLVT